jgi:hypothetical protein
MFPSKIRFGLFLYFFLVVCLSSCEIGDVPAKTPSTSRLSTITILSARPPNEFLLEVDYYKEVGDNEFKISCNVPNSDGSMKTISLEALGVTGIDIHTETLNVQKAGTYTVNCDDGSHSAAASFTVTEPEPAVVEPQPAPAEAEPPAVEPPPAAPEAEPVPEQQNAACLWQVAGTWEVSQINDYHPTFSIIQVGSTLTGTATLTAEEASKGGYTGTVGTGTGSVEGSTFTFVVTWPVKKDGKVISGTYTGTITEGRIEEPTGIWSATGQSACVVP